MSQVNENKQNVLHKNTKIIQDFRGKLPSEKELYIHIKGSIPSRYVARCERRIAYDEGSFESDFYDNIQNRFCARKWIEILRKHSTVQVRASEHSTGWNECNISAVIDAVLKFGEHSSILMVKSIPHEKFKNIESKNPPRSHVLDAMLQAWLVNLQNALILYEDRSTLETHIVHVEVVLKYITAMRTKFVLLKEHNLSGRIPARPYKSSEANECKKCPFVQQCWEN